ncbi:MAG TPA: hypothetical protein VGC42_23900, partial [Kofleriaceae bacterium]
MGESFVDLTYRGISLGKRIKLGQVRPSTGWLEVAAPMPVGTPLVIATDDGVAIDATVTWVHESVTGADRPPGMVVSPALGVEASAAWWKARVELPEEEAPRRLTRTRPVTLRPRTQTLQTPPPQGAVAESAPSLAADLAARVAAAAGVAPPPVTAPASPRDAMRRTGEHQVIDDGNRTTIMQAIDPTQLPADVELGPPSEAETAVPMTGDANDTAGMEVTIDTGESSDDDTEGEAGETGEAGEAGETAEGGDPAPAASGDRSSP